MCVWSWFCFAVLRVLKFCNHLDGEERAGCFTLFSCCVVSVCILWLILMVTWVCLQCVIVEFPDRTHFSAVVACCWCARNVVV